MNPEPDTRTIWEQTDTKPVTRFGGIIPCESIKHRFDGFPAVDRFEHPDDCPLHLCADCSVRIGAHLISFGWRRISGWKQPA